MYAVVDLETTGGKFGQESIMEIAIFRFDGSEIVDQFISLVNPQKEIQPYVVQLTGITQKMIHRAPKFHEIAKRIVEMTEDAVLVAHNAPFDYRVLQEEFARLGFDYQRKTIDTIPFAQKLIPGLKSYGLDPLCDALGIINTNRHRADGDARATVKLLKILLQKDTTKEIESISKSRNNTTPNHPFAKQAEKLHNITGIYYVHDVSGKIIYMSRSHNLRLQIDRHFLATNEKAIKLQSRAKSISIDETGSEIIARIKEHIELKKLKPFFNKISDRYDLNWGFYVEKNEGVIHLVRVQKIKKDNPLIFFDTENEALEFAAKFILAAGLNLDKVTLSFQKDRIKRRMERVGEVPKLKLKDPRSIVWRLAFPFQNGIIIDKGRKTGEKSILFIEGGKLKGYAYPDLAYQLEEPQLLKNILTVVPGSAYLSSLAHYALAHHKDLTTKEFK